MHSLPCDGVRVLSPACMRARLSLTRSVCGPKTERLRVCCNDAAAAAAPRATAAIASSMASTVLREARLSALAVGPGSSASDLSLRSLSSIQMSRGSAVFSECELAVIAWRGG
eukprot:1354445-Rhodomonas_salina.1